jgi:hypothetical protein
LAQAPRSRGAALQEFSQFSASERVENASPFEKNGGDIFPLTRHPALQIAAGPLEQSWIAPQSPTDQAIRRCIDAIDPLMIPRSHTGSIDNAPQVRE